MFVLASGVLIFRENMMDITSKNNGISIDSFEKCITLASLCHLHFRTNILKPNTLAFIPETGYNSQNNHSFKQIMWLNYLAKKNNILIQHARNKGEHKIGEYFLDGYNQNSDTGFEFHGCFFHGCKKCYSEDTFNSVLQSKMKTIRERHDRRIEYLKKNLTNLVEIWECDYDKIKCKDLEELKLNNPIVAQLNPREALFGGRTNATMFLCSKS